MHNIPPENTMSSCPRFLPPTDGRPRAVWKDDHVTVEPAGAPLSSACLSEIFALTDSELLHLHSGDYTRALAPRPGPAVFLVAAALYTPRFYGPRIVVAHP